MSKRRMEAFDALLQRIDITDEDEREHAIVQLALLLEKSHVGDSGLPDMDADMLDRHLATITLSEGKQREAIDAMIAAIARQNRSKASLFWALGRARPDLALPSLLALLKASGKNLDERSAYQAVRALDTLLQALDDAAEHLALNDPAPLLKRWQHSSDADLRHYAGRVLRRL